MARFCVRIALFRYAHFQPSVDAKRVVAATSAYFQFCQRVHRRVVMPASGEAAFATGANDSQSFISAALETTTHHLCLSLSSLMQVHRALAKALFGSLLIWVEAIVKQLNGISRVCTTRPVLACTSAGSVVLVNECMVTLNQLAEAYVVCPFYSLSLSLSLSFILSKK